MQKSICKLLPMLLLSGATAFAGTFTSAFNDPNQSGYTLNQVQDASGNSYPAVTNSSLLLLANEASLGPLSFVLNDLDNGAAIESFTADFQLQLGPGTGTPADGIAFVFGPDITSATTFSEEGPYMGDGGVSVCFVVYSGDGPGIGVNARVAEDSSQLGGIVPDGFVPMQSGTMVDSQMHNVSIQLNRNGVLNMVWNGQVVYTNLFLPGWTPVNGQFAIGGRNGGLSEQVIISNLVITTTPAPSTAAPVVVTTPPQSVTVNEGGTASFSLGFDGDAPISFQWTENGNPIPNATSNTLVLTEVSFTNNNARIGCTISNPAGATNSATATLTVVPDTTAPKVAGVVADFTFTNLVVTFSKPVSDTALAATNYTLNQGVSVLSVTRINQTTVALLTSPMPQDTAFVLTVNRVADTAATPNVIAANTQYSFESFTYLNGTILHKVYYNCSPDSFTINNLLSDPRYPNNPDRVDLATGWEWPPNDAGTFAADTNKSMFYDSLEGYFMPPTTGDYVFYTCGDDEWYLYLSTNNNPANIQLVAEETGGWSNNRDWVTGQGGTDMTPCNSGTFAGTTWPAGNTITLNQGNPYYMILFHHDHSWSGGDWYGATYQGPSDASGPSDGDATKLTSSVIGFDFNPAGSSIIFSQQPQNASVLEGAPAVLTVSATGASPYGTNVAYQWQSLPLGSTNWSNIPNATSASLATPVLSLTDNGTQYRVIASMATISLPSSAATLTVLVDTTPPVLSAGAMAGSNGTVYIGVGFNKAVADATGSLAGNYSVSSGTITAFQWCSNRFTADSENPLEMVRKQNALLTVTGFSGSGTVTVKNIADTFGNVVASTNLSVTVATNLTWGVVGANELGGWNAAVPVGPGAFDLYSDGIAEWTTYDETTFVYEQVTGDFDKVLRVQYQDGSSEWARAGLVARDVLNLGVSSSLQTGSANPSPPYDGVAGRYQKCHVNPVGPCLGPTVGVLANASWEGNRRLDTGGPSDTCLTNVNATPLYPDAWCRIQRQGQTFTIFRSADGTNWEKLGQTVWGQDDLTKTPMPATMYVGPEFTPENGNIANAIDQGTFLAQMRDYGDYAAAVTLPTLTLSNVNGTFTLTYTGTLQSSANVDGPYTAVQGAKSPFQVDPRASGAATTTFYRAAQ